jgi:chromosome segregation ATPase
MEKQLTDRQIVLVEKTQLIEALRTELLNRDNELKTRMWDPEEKQATLDSLQNEILSRNRIIDALRTQLTENQTGLLEKTLHEEQLHDTLEHHQRLLQETENDLQKTNTELKVSIQLLEKKDSDLQSLQQELGTRGKDLQIKQQEIADLAKQFQEICSNFKAATIPKNPATKMSENQPSTPVVNNPLSILKEDQPIIPNEKKSFAGDMDHIINNEQEHIDHLHEDITWKEKLRICNEIDRCLDHSTDDHLKTKKLKDDEETK